MFGTAALVKKLLSPGIIDNLQTNLFGTELDDFSQHAPLTQQQLYMSDEEVRSRIKDFQNLLFEVMSEYSKGRLSQQDVYKAMHDVYSKVLTYVLSFDSDSFFKEYGDAVLDRYAKRIQEINYPTESLAREIKEIVTAERERVERYYKDGGIPFSTTVLRFLLCYHLEISIKSLIDCDDKDLAVAVAVASEKEDLIIGFMKKTSKGLQLDKVKFTEIPNPRVSDCDSCLEVLEKLDKKFVSETILAIARDEDEEVISSGFTTMFSEMCFQACSASKESMVSRRDTLVKLDAINNRGEAESRVHGQVSKILWESDTCLRQASEKQIQDRLTSWDETLSLLEESMESIYTIKGADEKAILRNIDEHLYNVSLSFFCNMFEKFLETTDQMVKVNQHRHPGIDRLLGIKNTRGWQQNWERIREQAFNKLVDEVHDDSQPLEDRLATLETAQASELFSLHRSNFPLFKLLKPRTLKKINNLEDELRKANGLGASL